MILKSPTGVLDALINPHRFHQLFNKFHLGHIILHGVILQHVIVYYDIYIYIYLYTYTHYIYALAQEPLRLSNTKITLGRNRTEVNWVSVLTAERGFALEASSWLGTPHIAIENGYL